MVTSSKKALGSGDSVLNSSSQVLFSAKNGHSAYTCRCSYSLETGDHICCIYDGRNEFFEILADYIKKGVEQNHMIVYFPFTYSACETSSTLRSLGCNVEEMVAKGQLVMMDETGSSCVTEGQVDWQKALWIKTEVERRAAAEGYGAVRLAVDMEWTRQHFSGNGGPRALCEFECHVTSMYFAPNIKCIDMCMYDANTFDSRTLSRVLETHPQVFVWGQLYDNIFFVPPEDFLQSNEDFVLHKRMDNLIRRREVEAKLREGREEALRLKQRAEEQRDSKSTFLAQMSHEIRTPMSGIVTAAEMLAATDLTGEQRELVELMKASSGQLLRTVNEVLLFSKADCNMLTLERSPMCMRNIFAQAEQAYRQAAKDAHVTLSFDVNDNAVCWVLGDCTNLLHVVGTLVSYFISRTRQGENISVTCKREEPPAGGDDVTLQFTFADSIEMKDGEFDGFWKTDVSTISKYGHTGLGLAICARLVGLMGGKIWVTPETPSPGVGTQIHFTIVVAKVQNEKVKAGRKEGRRARRGKRVAGGPSMLCENSDLDPMRLSGGNSDSSSTSPPPNPHLPVKECCILLADDNRINRRVVGRLLCGLGCGRVDLAEDGEQAVSMCSQNRYDVVLLDIHMPVMDGYEAAQELRARGRDKDTNTKVPKLVALSAESLQFHGEKGHLFDHFLLKPVTKTQLVSALSDMGIGF